MENALICSVGSNKTIVTTNSRDWKEVGPDGRQELGVDLCGIIIIVVVVMATNFRMV